MPTTASNVSLSLGKKERVLAKEDLQTGEKSSNQVATPHLGTSLCP